MLETWASLKVFTEYIIPISLFIICIILLPISVCVNSYKWGRKIKLLKSNGFERYLIGATSVGGGAFYGWKNDQTGINIDERDLANMKYATLKRKISKDNAEGNNGSI